MKKLRAGMALLLALCLAAGCLPALAADKATAPSRFTVRRYADGVAVTAYTGAARNVVVPDVIYGRSVLAIDKRAFAEKDNLASVRLPPGVLAVRNEAFRDCENLKTVVLGATVRKVGPSAFAGCDALRKLYVPASVTSIAPDAFSAGMRVELRGTSGSYAESFVKKYAGPAKLTFRAQSAPISVTISGLRAMQPGETLRLSAAVSPQASEVRWSSGAATVATVDATGLVTAHQPGTALITARAGAVKATHAITVTKPGEILADSLPSLFATPADNKTPIRRLATLSARFTDYVYTPETVKSEFAKLGFTNVALFNYPNPTSDHGLAYAIASRALRVNGQEKTLYAVALRGTCESGKEWLSNLDMGSGGEHLGFSTAGEEVYKKLVQRMGEAKPSDCLVWLSGFSRGAAVGNYVAKRLWDDGFAQGNLYAYGFACPSVTLTPDAKVSVFNFNVEDDFVPRMPLTGWGYGRHGKTITLLDSDPDYPLMKKRFEKIAETPYKAISGEQSAHIANFILRYAPGRVKFSEAFTWVRKRAPEELVATVEAFFRGDFGDIAWKLVLLAKKIALGAQSETAASLGGFIGDLIKLIGSFDGMMNAHDTLVYLSWMESAQNLR